MKLEYCTKDSICENCGKKYNCANTGTIHMGRHNGKGVCSTPCLRALAVKRKPKPIKCGL